MAKLSASGYRFPAPAGGIPVNVCQNTQHARAQQLVHRQDTGAAHRAYPTRLGPRGLWDAKGTGKISGKKNAL